MNTALLLWGLLFGSIGTGFLIYGRRQRAIVPLLCGLALIIVPYCIPNPFVLVAVCIAIMAIPYFIRL